MDLGSCAEVRTQMDQNENLISSECSSFNIAVLESSYQTDHLGQVESQNPCESAFEISTGRTSECNASNQKLLLDPSGCVTEDAHSAFNGKDLSDYSQRLQDRDSSRNKTDGRKTDTHLSDRSRPYFTDDAEVCGTTDYPDNRPIARDLRSSSPELASIPDLDCSPDSTNGGNFFARSGSDHGRDPFRSLFNRHLDHFSDLSFTSRDLQVI